MRQFPLNEGWLFREGSDRFFMFAGADAGVMVDLPHDFIIGKPRDPAAISGASSGFFPGGEGSYTKNFALPDDWRGKRVILLIDGAYMNSEVTLNGDLLYLHPYGYTAYQLDLTEKLRAENSLKISCKCFQPNSRWYSGAGLYRGASVLIGEQTCVNPWDVFITTPIIEKERAIVRVRGHITGFAGDCELKINLAQRGFVVSAADFDISFDVNNPRLWSVDEPNLYNMKLSLGEDVTEIKFGIRKIEISAENGFRLNGAPMKLRGGCIHHDNAMLGACAFPSAERRKVEKLKAAGYTALRIAHNPPSSALLDACDELGMLVLDESFDMWRSGKNSLDYHLYFEDWWRRDTESMVRRDRNHPCVYAWSIGNEVQELLGASDGAKWAKLQADFVRNLDDTRPVSASANGFTRPVPGKTRKPRDFKRELAGKPVMGLPDGENDDWGDQTRAAGEALDIFGYNYMYGRYAHDVKAFPGRVIHATETHAFHTYDYWRACVENPNCIGDFIWTACDNLGEAGAGRVIYDIDAMRGGLIGGWPWLSCNQGDLDLSLDARPQNYYRRVMWGLDKGAHLFVTPPERADKPFYGMGWHWEDVLREWTFDRSGADVKLQAYCDCDEIEFVINGESVAKAPVKEYRCEVMAKYRPGAVEAIAYRNGKIMARDKIETALAPAHIALIPEKSTVAPGDIAFIRAELRDINDKPVTNVITNIRVEVTGAGALAGVGSGNPCTDENYTAARNTHNGAILIAARAKTPGAIAVRAATENLPAAEITVSVM